jgi:hypothetical protein
VTVIDLCKLINLFISIELRASNNQCNISNNIIEIALDRYLGTVFDRSLSDGKFSFNDK